MDATLDAAVGRTTALTTAAVALADPLTVSARSGPADEPPAPAASVRAAVAEVTGTPARPAPSAAPAPPAGERPGSSAQAAQAVGAQPADAPVVPAQAGPGDAGRPAGLSLIHIWPVLTELRLSAFGPHRSAAFPLGPVTLFAGPSGSGKSQALAAYEALTALGSGATLEQAFPDPGARIPDGAVPDAQRRRGFRLGCTIDGPAGPVRLDLAVQAEGRSCSPPPCATPAGARSRPPG